MNRISSIFMTKTRLPTVNIVYVGMMVVLGWEGGKPFGFPQDLMGSGGFICLATRPTTTTPIWILLVRSFCKLYFTCVTFSHEAVPGKGQDVHFILSTQLPLRTPISNGLPNSGENRTYIYSMLFLYVILIQPGLVLLSCT